MNAKELAALLDGREIGREITEDECELAKQSNLLVVFGASDDLTELRGFVEDEFGCYDGGACLVDANGIRKPWPDEDTGEPFSEEEAREYFAREALPSFRIIAIWHDEGDASWTYVTGAAITERFTIREGEDVYCRGVVIDCDELLPKETETDGRIAR